MMKRGLALTLALVAAGLLVTLAAAGRAPDRVYTVAQVQAGLALRPGAWVGRSVLVRARALEAQWTLPPHSFRIVDGGTPVPLDVATGSLLSAPAMGCIAASRGCASPLPVYLPPGTVIHVALLDSVPGSGVAWPAALVAAVQPAPPWLAGLRSIPWIGRLAPPGQRVAWGTPQVYRLQLVPKSPTCHPICDDAILLDTAAQ